MRATRAYIASAGTASVMLGAALATLVLVSAFVAFGSWPGESAAKRIDQVVLNEVAKPKAAQKVAVGTAAIKANRRAEVRRQVAIAKAERRDGKPTIAGDPVAKTPRGSVPTTAAGTPVASAPTDSSTVNAVRQQTQNVTQNVTQGVQNTTDQVTGGVQQQVDQTTTQVNQVVDQVVGTVEQTTSTTTQQVQSTVDNTTTTLTNTVGGVLGN